MFLITFGGTIERGAQITTNLLIQKICHEELNYPDDICTNLTNTGFEDYNTEVQKKVNNFLMVSEWIGRTPALVYSFFGGWDLVQSLYLLLIIGSSLHDNWHLGPNYLHFFDGRSPARHKHSFLMEHFLEGIAPLRRWYIHIH